MPRIPLWAWELCQDWCCDHIPGEQFISCSLLLFPDTDFNNRVKVSVRYRNLQECEWECRASPHGHSRVGKPGYQVNEGPHGHRQDGTKWQRGGRATGNHRPEDAGATTPRNPRRARGRRSHVPLCAPVPVPVPVPLTAAPARARSPARRRRLASHAAPVSPRAPAPPRKRRARRHGNAARPARAQPPPHTHLQKEVI